MNTISISRRKFAQLLDAGAVCADAPSKKMVTRTHETVLGNNRGQSQQSRLEFGLRLTD
jgi:hypothetical protein